MPFLSKSIKRGSGLLHPSSSTTSISNKEDNEPVNKRIAIEYSTDHQQNLTKFLIWKKPFKVPIPGFEGRGGGGRTMGYRKDKIMRPLHNESTPNSLVLFSPPSLGFTEKPQQVHVVVDPILSTYLRSYQREGVRFLWECVTGIKTPGTLRAILADDPGMGKMLQIITLIWTLLKQSPKGKPEIRNAVIIAPSFLVNNWKNQICKWLGDKVTVIMIKGGSKEEIENKLEESLMGEILIISYEDLREIPQVLTKMEVGIVIYDVRHDKNWEEAAYNALDYFESIRRVILSDNDGIFGGLNLERGDEQVHNVTALVKKSIIRRRSTLLTNYLPTRVEMVVCCKLTSEQMDMYKKISAPSTLNNPETIMRLRKLCNHPNLTQDVMGSELRVEGSGKFRVLENLLLYIRKISADKIVLLSHNKETVDYLVELCRLGNYGAVRVDENTEDAVLANFNDSKNKEPSIVILSIDQCRRGTNLTGATRLIIFDPQSSNDPQIINLIWREGQKKQTFVYRMVATGTFEERMLRYRFQNDPLTNSKIREMNCEGFKEFIKLEEDTDSDSHDNLKCTRCVNGIQGKKPTEGSDCTSDLGEWNHSKGKRGIPDVALKKAVKAGGISFVFHQKSHEQKTETLKYFHVNDCYSIIRKTSK